MATMQSLQFTEAGTLEFREVPEPRLGGALEALVRPVVASVCDIDRPVLSGTAPWKGPFAFGHEAVGEVVEVGERVKTVRPGDLVAIAWHVNCGVCDRCLMSTAARMRRSSAKCAADRRNRALVRNVVNLLWAAPSM